MFYILSTGTELSTGRSTDTNGPFMARTLSEAGLEVSGMGILPDDPELILEELRRLLSKKEIQAILMTGGLGPTADDHTVDVLCKLSGRDALEDPAAMRRVEAAARLMRGRLKLESARRQTRVVSGSTVLQNERGMAPGMMVELSDLQGERTLPPIVAAMPGVPSEMTRMFETILLPEFKERYIKHKRSRLTFLIYGMGESNFQTKLFGSETEEAAIKAAEFPPDFRWGVTAHLGFIKLFFETENRDFLKRIDDLTTEFFPDQKLSEPAEDLLHNYFNTNSKTLSLAESCSGGLISKLITDKPGSSKYFKAAAVVYANEAKISMLGVDSSLIQQHGAVSEEVARAMAEGAVKTFGTDLALSITGIAGPDGGTKEKPVGTVHIALASKTGSTESQKMFLPFDRDRIRDYASRMALFYLFKYVTK